LGISVQEFNGMRLNQISEYQFFPIGCANCEAETFEYDLDGQPGSEVMLRIGERSPYVCRYLIFKNVNEKWKLLGHLDAEGKYRKPQHTILINHGTPWVDIQEQGANGTGVASYVDTVYLVTPSKITRGFAYLSEGSQFGGPGSDNRDFNGRILDCSLRGNVVTVHAQYSVEYFGDDNLLFSKTHNVVFSERLGGDKYIFDRAHSDISEKEFDAVYDIDSLSDEDFLKYNYAALSEIATGTDLKHKEWLRNFLPNCENTIERRRLSQMLSRAN
jgi:hypothetical protein